ncbi:integrase [Mucilaginibacter sp. UYNi724]
MTRINQLGNEVTTIEKGMQAGGIYSHMRDLRTLFNEARKIYNNEDIGVVKIKHYPFKVYKIGAPPKTRKRNISAEQLIKIKNCAVKPNSRAELAKELFLLSFYMCGMNAVDFYNLISYDPQSTRLEYNRSKTKGLRNDGALISIKIVPEARPMLEKYIGKLQERYSTYNGLDTALSKGITEVRKVTGVADITFYWARHTFATIARNKCQMDKDDIAEALNHVDGDHKITDIYIEKDWSVVDKVQAAVLKLFKELNKPKPIKPQKNKITETSDSVEQRKTMRLVSA